MIFGPSWSIWDIKFFLPEKKCFDTFRWVSPFSIIFLKSQSSGFASSVWNLVQNWHFEFTTPARLTALQKKREKSQNSVTRHFFLVWRLSPHKISANYILTKFGDVPLAKSVILTHFSIFLGHTLKWGFFFEKIKKWPFSAKKLVPMACQYQISPKISFETIKKSSK